MPYDNFVFKAFLITKYILQILSKKNEFSKVKLEGSFLVWTI